MLLEIWEQMKEKSFLNYNVDIKRQEEHMEDFIGFGFCTAKTTFVRAIGQKSTLCKSLRHQRQSFQVH